MRAVPRPTRPRLVTQLITSPRIRVCVGVVALALLLGGCGDAKPQPEVGSGLTTTTQAGAPSTGQSGDASPTTARVTSGPSATGKGGTTPTTRRAATNDDDAAIRAAAQRAPGALAGVLLAPGPAKQLVIDVLVQSGQSADATTLSQIKAVLAQQSGKPVVIKGPTTLPTTSTDHSADDVRRLATERGLAQGGGNAVVHLLYLAGQFEKESALGVAVRADTLAVFPEQMRGSASPLVGPSRIERAVVMHEFGHVMGLVDLYLDEERDDPEHPGHSKNRDSVMYWAVESDVIGQLFGGPPPVDFDSADLADLRKIRAGAAPS